MMTFLATSNEEDLLTPEVSDEALEAAEANEAAGILPSRAAHRLALRGLRRPGSGADSRNASARAPSRATKWLKDDDGLARMNESSRRV